MFHDPDVDVPLVAAVDTEFHFLEPEFRIEVDGIQSCANNDRPLGDFIQSVEQKGATIPLAMVIGMNIQSDDFVVGDVNESLYFILIMQGKHLFFHQEFPHACEGASTVPILQDLVGVIANSTNRGSLHKDLKNPWGIP